jgi:hypothetical protein
MGAAIDAPTAEEALEHGSRAVGHGATAFVTLGAYAAGAAAAEKSEVLNWVGSKWAWAKQALRGPGRKPTATPQRLFADLPDGEYPDELFDGVVGAGPGGIGPVLKGRVGEALSEAEALAAGETKLASQVTFELPSGARTRPDLLTGTPAGALKVREAKMGPGARLTGPQEELERTVKAGGTVIPRGAKATKAGLKPGQPVTLQHFEEDRY